VIGVCVGLQRDFKQISQERYSDQTWLGGLWDAADDDDAILAVQSTIGTVETFVDISARTPLVPTLFTPPPLVTGAVRAPFPPNQTRAPPVL